MLTLALGLVVAIAIKLVGALLIGEMLIIPAAAVRPWARSPETIALWATSVTVVAALVCLQASLCFETPPVPTIICLVIFLRSMSARG